LLKALVALLEDFPYTYRDEMVDFLAEEFDVSVSLDTISRALKAANLSRKKVQFKLIFSLNFSRS